MASVCYTYCHLVRALCSFVFLINVDLFELVSDSTLARSTVFFHPVHLPLSLLYYTNVNECE